MRGPIALLALQLAAFVAGAAAQAPADSAGVDPGGVTTTVVTLEAPAGADSLRYSVTPAEGVRLFARPGRAAVPPGGAVRIPVTFGLPTTAAAGLFVAGTLRGEWSTGGVVEERVVARVRARRGASFQVGAESVTATRGAAVEVSYHLQNLGNAVDTFRVTVDAPAGWDHGVSPEAVLLAPGDTASGTVVLTPAETALRGEEPTVAVTVAGDGVREVRTVRALVVVDDGWLGDLSQVPATAFIGSSSGPGSEPGLALTAAGEIRPDLRLALDFRHLNEITPAPAFRGILSGPRLRVGLSGPWGHVRAGDVYTYMDVFAGPAAQGRGVDATIQGGAYRASVTAAAPTSYGFGPEDGHVLRAAGDVATAGGRIGFELSSVRRRSDVFGSYANTGGGLTYALRSGPHRVDARFGVLRVADDSAGRTGLAGQADYAFEGDRGTFSAHLRQVPGTTSRTGSVGDEATFSGSLFLARGFALSAWGFTVSAPRIGPDTTYSRSDGFSAGIRGNIGWGVTGELQGTYRASGQVGTAIPAITIRTARSRISIPLGRFMLDADGELGTMAADSVRPYRRLQADARFADRGQWGSLGMSVLDLGSGLATTLDLAAFTNFRTVEIQGGVNARLDAAVFADALTLWSGFSVPLGDDYRIDFGADYRPTGAASPWRLSLGARRSFNLPLPLPRQPVARGVVFDDRDGDLTRDPGEPLVGGLTVLFGRLRTTTDQSGEFRFYDDGNGPIGVDITDLPDGYTVARTRTIRSGHGAIEIPVIQVATLHLRLFLDRDGDRERDPAEVWASRLPLSLRGPDLSVRLLSTDEQGEATLRGLAPGRYTLEIGPTVNAPASATPLRVEIELEPGASVERVIAVPLRRREIRITTGAEGTAPPPGQRP